MADWHQSIGSLGDRALARLSEMLDNPTCGWRQLANVVTVEQPRFSCRWLAHIQFLAGAGLSETELTSCSLQVMSPTGSPGRYLLARLADRACSVGFLLHCLKKIDHQGAVQYLTTTVTEQVRINVQPQSQQVSEGGRVLLTCKACGPPGLNYQWFRGKEEILGGTGSAPELVLCPLSPLHVGHYICRVNNGEHCIFSQWAQVRFLHNSDTSPGCSSSLFPGSVSGLQVVCQPQSQTLSEGDALFLKCSADANPPAQYQWYHNMEPMAQQKQGTLRIPCVTTAYRGQYSCRLFNLYHETWSDTVQVNIGPSSISDSSSWSEVDHGTDRNVKQQQNSQALVNPASPHPARHKTSFDATDKVALLIGNMNYRYHNPLCAPMADVHELANLLRQLDFKVVSLLDLDCQEMHSAVAEFLLLLDKGVYGLLYFAGHGYENFGNSFMVPIDAPAAYTSEHCLCVQSVLQRMQERETGLNVFLLDMCRKRNLNDDVATQSRPLKVTANIVFGYATCVDAEAYEEVQRDDLSNGSIFISFLKQRLREDEKVTVMLDRVAEDMGQCKIMRGRQALELRSNLSERRTLADRIRNSDCPAATSARNLQWSIAHVLPESRSLLFDCGVKVQLGFAAEYSNIMIIYTRILEKPKNITSCSAQLTDFSDGPAVDLKKSNQESLAEAGSFCLLTMVDLPSPDVPSLYTRLHSLQRLKTELTFTVCLHYRYTNLDEEIQEQQSISVGKPLVSKLNLHKARMPRSSSASSCDPDSFNLPESSSFTEDFETGLPNSETSSIGSASTMWSYHHPEAVRETDSTASATSPGKLNVPEETDSPELFDSDAPKPLTANKSLPYSQGDDNNYKFSHAYDFHSS